MILTAVVLMSAAASGGGVRADLDFELPYPDVTENGLIRTGHGEQNRHELNLVGGDDQTLWRVTLPSRPLRVALAPDLDDDLFREIRVQFSSILNDGSVEMQTWILSGRSGDLLFDIRGSAPFDPWIEIPGDINNDGEVAADDGMNLLLPLRRRPDILPPFSPFGKLNVSRKASLPANVTRSDHHELIDRAQPRGSDAREETPPVSPLGGGSNAIVVTEVRFKDSHDVYPDGSSEKFQPNYLDYNIDGDADDWSVGDRKAPIAYTINDSIEIRRVRIFIPPGSIEPINIDKIEGKVGSVTFTSIQFAVEEDGIILATSFVGSVTAPNTIDYQAEWTITWSIKEFGVFLPHKAGTSKNDLHIVLQDPTGNFDWHHTMLYLGCKGAKGLDSTSSHQQIADAIFAEEFDDQAVYRATDRLEFADVIGVLLPMQYYGDWRTGIKDEVEMLKYANKDGQCYAWARLFIRCMHVVGIDPPLEYVNVISDAGPFLNGPAAAFIVKNWNFDDERNPDHWSKDDLGYLSINIPFVPDPLFDPWGFITSSSFTWACNPPDVADATGVPGQSTDNPVSYFGDHQVVVVGGKVYDPSYGVTYTDLDDFETKAIEGYVIDFLLGILRTIDEEDLGCDIDGDENYPENDILTSALVFKPNPPGNQLTPTASDYLQR